MIKRFKSAVWTSWNHLAKWVSNAYILGPDLEDALAACRQVAPEYAATVCYWNVEGEPPEKIRAAYLRALDALKRENIDTCLAVKAPALQFDSNAFHEIFTRSRETGIRLHFDSHEIDAADRTFDRVKEGLQTSTAVGCTLPGRWPRSLKDADWAAEQGVRVRVVKGHWADPRQPDIDPGTGFLAVIDRLAGRAKHVGVATHDSALAREALKRLRAKQTPCELELLFGLPWEGPCQVAVQAGVRVRMYLPYGYGWLPYCLSQVRQNPRILRWVLQDAWNRRSRLPTPALS